MGLDSKVLENIPIPSPSTSLKYPPSQQSHFLNGINTGSAIAYNIQRSLHTKQIRRPPPKYHIYLPHAIYKSLPNLLLGRPASIPLLRPSIATAAPSVQGLLLQHAMCLALQHRTFRLQYANRRQKEFIRIKLARRLNLDYFLPISAQPRGGGKEGRNLQMK